MNYDLFILNIKFILKTNNLNQIYNLSLNFINSYF